MYNGYEHPGPAPRELTPTAGESFEQRAERRSRERYESLNCKAGEAEPCAICILWGDAYCHGDAQPLKPLTIEDARRARELIAHEGQRQAEQTERRQALIDAQVTKATAAGHDVKRIERAAALVNDSAALEAAAAKYSTTPAGCQCPDRKHGPANRKCKHQLAAIISANVSRQMQGEAPQEIEALPASETTGDSPYTRMKTRDARAQAQAKLETEPSCPTCGFPTDKAVCPVCATIIDPLSDDVPLDVLDPAAMPVHQPELTRDDDGMLWA